MSGVERIAAERERQRHLWGASPDDNDVLVEHDDSHTRGELARLAAAYALPVELRAMPILNWTLASYIIPNSWGFKPSPENRIRELEKAGALIAAEIDRLERCAKPSKGCLRE